MHPSVPSPCSSSLTRCVVVLAVAAGFYVILSGVFIATHAKAATVTQAMALAFSDTIAPWILMNHNIFIVQGLATSTQVGFINPKPLGYKN